ncbi:MAG: sulfatase-like hydrolase/transferase [Acidobacteriota bacterium]|nr:MAG: sulfatase-like hydrolase/transferase [Acidobacteriota bacterium]
MTRIGESRHVARSPGTGLADICRPGLIGVALLLVAACSAPSTDSDALPATRLGEGPPTVLLITVDTLRADRLGCFGRDDAGTPRLDALAADGVRFASAHTTAQLTLPAHASILTGRALPAHGVRNNGTFALPESVPLLQ